MFSDRVETGGDWVGSAMPLYSKVMRTSTDRLGKDRRFKKADSMLRRLELTDEEFLIVISNKLKFLEHEKLTVWPAIIYGFRQLLAIVGVKLKQKDIAIDKILLTGMELTKLRELTGFEEHEKISLQDDYEMELPVLRKLLVAAVD